MHDDELHELKYYHGKKTIPLNMFHSCQAYKIRYEQCGLHNSLENVIGFNCIYAEKGKGALLTALEEKSGQENCFRLVNFENCFEVV